MSAECSLVWPCKIVAFSSDLRNPPWNLRQLQRHFLKNTHINCIKWQGLQSLTGRIPGTILRWWNSSQQSSAFSFWRIQMALPVKNAGKFLLFLCNVAQEIYTYCIVSFAITVVMFLVLWNHLIEIVNRYFLVADHRLTPALSTVVALASILCLWRFWRFSVRPYFYPNDPKELPSWIPCTYSRFSYIDMIRLIHASHWYRISNIRKWALQFTFLFSGHAISFLAILILWLSKDCKFPHARFRGQLLNSKPPYKNYATGTIPVEHANPSPYRLVLRRCILLLHRKMLQRYLGKPILWYGMATWTKSSWILGSIESRWS